jgi:hypothetical protein
MPFQLTNARSRNATRSAHSFAPFVVFALLLFAPALVRAQQTPPGTIGRIEGADISVDGGTAAANGSAGVTPSIYVTSGSVITVHSGKAQMMLNGGGQIDICGPAKFTLLQSTDAVTLALSFGRMHVQLSAATTLRIFTPTIIATPIGIGAGPRDITVGLDASDSLCVLAASGALRLEQQFSGEGLIVPQSGEFFLAEGKLVPVAGTPGTCQCAAIEARVTITPPPSPIPQAGMSANLALSPPPPEAVTPQPPSKSDATPASGEPPAAEPDIEYSVLAHANDAHPNAAAPKPAPALPAPPNTSVEYKIELPPMSFSSASPSAPEAPAATEQMVLLIRYAHVNRDFEFSGHVDAPHAEPVAPRVAATAAPVPASSTALAAPATATASQPQATSQSQAAAPKKKDGFWTRLKHAFGGDRGPGPSPNS